MFWEPTAYASVPATMISMITVSSSTVTSTTPSSAPFRTVADLIMT